MSIVYAWFASLLEITVVVVTACLEVVSAGMLIFSFSEVLASAPATIVSWFSWAFPIRQPCSLLRVARLLSAWYSVIYTMQLELSEEPDEERAGSAVSLIITTPAVLLCRR